AEPAPQAAATPAVPAIPAPSTLPAATAVATPPPGAKATELPNSLQAAGTPVPSSEISGMSRDFTGGSMTYTFQLKTDCTIALHPPYTLEMLKTDLERWGVSPHLHYQRLGASHGGKSFFVVEAARHRNKGINPALPFVVLLAREHGNEPAVNWVVRGLIDRLLANDGHTTLDRLRLVLFPFVNQDGATQGMTVDPYTGLDVGNDFGRAGTRPPGSPGGSGEGLAGGGLTSAPATVGGGEIAGGVEFKLPETRLLYKFVAEQIRAGRHCLGAISLHQPHGGQENIWPVYYLGPGRNCLDRSLTGFQQALHRHTRRFTHAIPDFWPIRVSVGRFDHDFGIPGVTLEINPHCARHPLSVPDLLALGADLADTLGDWAGPA
ncbi:MAG TPA: M14 family zinc carboxypeptidase, partial [Planctomycetota bacterium]|nr:M14 family zinc carboxypeptidase [Planctomycetota bacterium]